MRGDGTGFDKLYQRIPGSDGIIMSEMRNERFAISFHFDDSITKFHDKFVNFFTRRNFFQIALIEVQDKFLPEKIFFFFIW